MTLGDVGGYALIGGVLGETLVRLARLIGRQPTADGWRDGTFAAAAAALIYWLFRELVI